jgi:hypothetical protein
MFGELESYGEEATEVCFKIQIKNVTSAKITDIPVKI